MSLSPELRAWFDLYIGHFAAQDGSWVRQNAGDGSKWTVHATLMPETIHEAFTGGRYSVSGFTARTSLEGVVETHVGAIDFDTADGAEQARATRTLLADMGVGSMLVASRRGAHLWVWSEGRPIWASLMRRALTNALTLQGIEDPKVEVFPKRSGGTYGCGALRMPLMRHPGTGVRYPVEGPKGAITRVQDVVWLAVDVTSPPDALRALAGPEPVDTPYPRWNAVYGRPRGLSDDASITSLLASVGLSSGPGRSVRCPFHDDRHASLSVADDDQRAWCKAPECPLHNDGRGIGSRGLRRLLDEGATTREPEAHAPGPPGP